MFIYESLLYGAGDLVIIDQEFKFNFSIFVEFCMLEVISRTNKNLTTLNEESRFSFVLTL